ncbi:hypothetical protein VTN49DRAFT_2557 [Thermomyces lanuginosus]|uniref:uncharacterized protein n=1 Tax=Thermomyces lanuginosus TaxID=5541 RepID=UPI00374202BD
MSPDDFFDTLLEHKSILDVNPYLVSSDHDGIWNAYCLLHSIEQDSLKLTARYTNAKARRVIKTVYDISKTLFVLVSASFSMKSLASVSKDEILPRIGQWWEQHRPSELFLTHAITILRTLEERKIGGELMRRARRTRTFRRPRNPRFAEVRNRRINWVYGARVPSCAQTAPEINSAYDACASSSAQTPFGINWVYDACDQVDGEILKTKGVSEAQAAVMIKRGRQSSR